MALLVFILFLITILVTWYQRKFYRRNALLAKIPGYKSYPIVGSNLALIGKSASEIFEIFQEASEKLGPVWRLDLNPFTTVVFTSDVKMIESLLSSQKLHDKGNGYNFVRGWLQEGLLLSTGKKWHQRRRIITPAFHFNILQQFVEIMDHHGQICVSNLKKFDGQEIDFFSRISLYALDVICESAMGCKINAQKNSESEYIKAVKEIANIIFLRTFNQFKRIDFLYQFTEMYQREQKALKVLHNFTDSVIVSRRKELESTSHADNNENEIDFGIKKRKAFLDLLLQSTIDGNPLTNSDIREEVDTFMFGGHDTTTTSATCFTLYNLAKYPEIQEKVFEECKTTLGDDLQQPVTIHDLNNLHYLELTIKETLRLYPSVPCYGRNIKEDVTIGHLTIPKNTNVNVAAFFLGRNPDLFLDPLKFDPLSFDAETNNEKNNSYAYVPSSAGIGQKFAMLEMKSIVAKIIRNFKLSVTKENEKLELIAELVLRPVNGVKLRVQKRNND
ncbi:CLUMA_CG008003, isoform A [Clunio marinus]|uniref:CLUMA_CG008003, isoform A n=1 Tax=Clunio marinus TaxID=568069 RepID=A0A1J1I418_9DIPT|nr:CLUMA_CG008003, isoform A [Clunio marinus]